eukprot:TRINITY_DN76_c0_g2_i1.p3 TRINITY_DN76_c0_g2~~TRINITY_DN76_c0_g2_i1.p3  ORF type:complete len:117 (-),score=32.48 TRINITY_DN76_c0_g2_i1:338-667(-)
MSYFDKQLTCRDCGAGFEFTAGQQEFFASKGFENEPSRCKECQSAKKASQGYGDDSWAGGGGYGGGKSGGYGKGGGGGGKGKGGDGCFKCGATDHWSRECPTGGGGGKW